MVSISVGRIDTRATNHDWTMNSRHANGGLNIDTNVSSAIEKKPPKARTGLAMASEATIQPVLPRMQFTATALRRPTPCCVWG